ncbi:aldehyde dehydrogenase [Pelagibacterales bacterium SAG-MED31]|nr:aldehyde dehydrogenase [Pelagibacterales bacterium SAG-MED31]
MIFNYENIKKIKSSLSFPSQLFINGKYQNSITEKSFENTSPIDGNIINKINFAHQDDIDLAVLKAREAFNNGYWLNLSPAERKKVLLKFATLLERDRLELSLLDTIDMGKTINDTYNADLPTSIDNVEWYAEIIDKLFDDISPSSNEYMGLITKEPIGVVAAIVPWNYPLWMAVWKIAPALITGNSVILKPAEQSPMSAIKIGAMLSEAGLPDGVFSVLPGDGPITGKSLCLHNDIDCVAFTGSGEVGKLVLQYSGQSNMKRVQLECGGKSPNIVFADCQDLDAAAEASAYAIFGNQGEVCSAGSRLIVQKEIENDFVEKVYELSKNMQPGDPFDPKSFAGAIVNTEQLDKINKYVNIGKKEGASVQTGGNITMKETGGCYFEPTIFKDVKNNMRIAQEEIFGPVLTTLTFSSFEEAITIANDTEYGLAAGVWTKDINKAIKASREIRAGTVYINNYEEGVDSTIPLGGYKQSGIGRDNGYQALENYLQVKSTWIKIT